ncbi:hypothetical protein Nmel_006231, partial [Mimus melanotis]
MGTVIPACPAAIPLASPLSCCQAATVS